MNTFDSFKRLTSSKKFFLAILKPKQRLRVFSVYSGNIYSVRVNHYVSNVLEDGATLTQASSLGAVSTGEFYYSSVDNILYVNSTDNSNPGSKFTVIEYSKFYSNIPNNGLTHNLSGGDIVEFEARVESVGGISQAIDSTDQIGVSVESKTSLVLNNADGGLDGIFDSLSWGNVQADLYVLGDGCPETECRKIYSATIQDKRYSENTISFNLADFTYNLRRPVVLPIYSDADGVVSESDKDKGKKLIYGRVEGVKLTGADKVLSGFELTGTVSGAIGSNAIVGTSFLSELSPSDTLIINDNSYSIESVSSDTSATLSDELVETISGESASLKPAIPYRVKNRKWIISGHKLREPITTITRVISKSKFEVASQDDLFADDVLLINGEYKTVKRVGNNNISLTTSMQVRPVLGDSVKKFAVSNVFFNSDEFTHGRDYTVTNNSGGAYVTIEDTAEFNVAKTRSIAGTFTFTNGSRSVTKTGGGDLEALIKPRDWIRGDDITHTIYYEVLSITDESTLIIRTPYSGTTDTSTNTKFKSPDYIADGSVVTCNCYGKENADGEWINTPARAVKDILSMIGITNINEAAFSLAHDSFRHTLSLLVTKDRAARDIITDINKSCFGSLYTDTNFEVCFSILDSEKPESINSIQSDDTLSFPKVDCKSMIYNKTIVNYRHYESDRFSGEDGFKRYEYQSDYITNIDGTEKENIIDIYLYDDNASQIMCQRYQLFYSLPQSVVSLGLNLEHIDFNLNDKIWLNLRRMYKRYGQIDNQKIGIISGVKKYYNKIDVEVSDLGNWFARVANIATDTSNDFTAAQTSEKIVNGYIVDNDLEIPDVNSEESVDCNLIG